MVLEGVFGGGRDLKKLLGEDLLKDVEEYARRRRVGVEDALRELVKKGIRYVELEDMYGKYVTDREVWDRRFYYLKVESAYLHCRLRVKELVEELRRFIIRYSGLAAALEICYERYAPKNERLLKELEELRRARRIADEYLDKYVLGGRGEGEEEGELSDEEVIKSIEEGLKKYKEILLKGRKASGRQAQAPGSERTHQTRM